MKFELFIKTNDSKNSSQVCWACLGVVKEFIKKIPGVSDVELDCSSGKITIDYEGKLSREEWIKIIKEKTGYELQ